MPGLNYVSFTPFGRGSASVGTNITTPYATLRTLLNTTKLDSSNFSPNAGWPEAYITFHTSGGHVHSRYNLARFSIGTTQLDKTTSTSNPGTGCGLLFTSGTGTLALAGVSPTFGMVHTLDPEKTVEVVFAEDGFTRQTFLAGTTPKVFVTPWVVIAEASLTFSVAIKCLITSVSSTGFTAVVRRQDGSPYNVGLKTMKLFWLAIGTAPGLIAQPGEMALIP